MRGEGGGHPPPSVAHVEKMESAPHPPRWMSLQCKLLKEILGALGWGRSGWPRTWKGWRGEQGPIPWSLTLS